MPDNRIDEFLAAFSRESTSRAIMKAITENPGAQKRQMKILNVVGASRTS
jgi:hypothetical protein